jgi:hypothetical protein
MPIAFTRVVLGACAASYARGAGSRLWAITTCLVWGTLLSFAAARVLDRTAYARIAARNGWSMRVFHAGNVVVHVLPACATLAWPPTASRCPTDGVLAVFVHATWLASVAGFAGLDELYVPLSPRVWRALFAVAFLAELLAPCVCVCLCKYQAM